ncbi:MAG: hypothetical protein ACJ741_13610 [Pyrinomonadaceae bacterium]
MTHPHLTTSVVRYLACLLVVMTSSARGQETASVSSEYVLEIGRGSVGTWCTTNPLGSPTRKAVVGFTVPPSPSTPPAGGKYLQASMIQVRVAPDDDIWRIDVSVQSGEFYDGAQKHVASYTARMNERVEIKEVVPFGAAPFTVAVMRVLRATAVAPQVANKTQSISVEKIESDSPIAPYQISLRNISGKDVLALEVNALKGGKRLGLMWPEARWLEPLIRAGSVHHMEVSSTDHSCGTARGYRPGQADTIEINTVVFADGSYEGEPYLAALIRAKAMGYERQSARVLEALDLLIGRSDPTTFEVAAQLNELLAVMDETVELAALDELHRSFPAYGEETVMGLGKDVGFSLHEIKRDLLADVKRFESKASEGQDTRSVRSWLLEMREKYAKRVAAARAVTQAGDAETK